VRNVSLTIPPNALPHELTLTLAISCNTSDVPDLSDNQHLVGPVVHCLPHGLEFNKPVTLSFHDLNVREKSCKILVKYRYKAILFVVFLPMLVLSDELN